MPATNLLYNNVRFWSATNKHVGQHVRVVEYDFYSTWCGICYGMILHVYNGTNRPVMAASLQRHATTTKLYVTMKSRDNMVNALSRDWYHPSLIVGLRADPRSSIVTFWRKNLMNKIMVSSHTQLFFAEIYSFPGRCCFHTTPTPQS